MAENGAFRFLVIDDFMPAPFVGGLLAYTLAHQSSFISSQVKRYGEDQTLGDERASRICSQGLGPFEQAFCGTIHAHLPRFFQALGVQPFAIARTELELVACGDGGKFLRHLDIFTQTDREGEPTDRVLSAVYYFHALPKRFTGGELAIYPVRDDAAIEVLQPELNRIVIFPSFAPHEVRKIACPSRDFADSRFSINCWLHRARGQAIAR